MRAWAVVETGKPLQEMEFPTPEPTGEQVSGRPPAVRLTSSICAARFTQLWFCAAIGPLSRKPLGMRYGSSLCVQTTISSPVEVGQA